MKIFRCSVILLALFVAWCSSVVLTGEYVNMKWFKNGPTKFTLQVGGVTVYKPNDYTVGINATNSYSNINVQCLMMDRNYMKYLPGNYTRLFPSVQFLVVRNAHVKYITNVDFLGLNQLMHLDFKNNDIEHLPGNLFKDISRISTVSFFGNKITNVGPNFIAIRLLILKHSLQRLVQIVKDL